MGLVGGGRARWLSQASARQRGQQPSERSILPQADAVKSPDTPRSRARGSLLGRSGSKAVQSGPFMVAWFRFSSIAIADAASTKRFLAGERRRGALTAAWAQVLAPRCQL